MRQGNPLLAFTNLINFYFILQALKHNYTYFDFFIFF